MSFSLDCYDNSLACIRPAPSTGQSDWHWNYPTTGPFLWGAQNRAGGAGPSWLRSTCVPASQEPASEGIFYGKNNKGNKGKRQEKIKKKSTKPKVTGEWWIGDKTETMLSLKKQSLWEKWQTPTAIFFSPNNFLIQSWGTTQSQL